jgi:alanyl-tRNA synthetase
MKTAEIRSAFLDFFKRNGHEVLDSSSLVPADDPTLLFTNAGMNQFKDTFLGKESRAYNRATTSQKCVRAGGKHNDLENVGYTARHHTFFEMLGNFSFGDYFKQDAIGFAWEFLTGKDWMNIPLERLYVTIYATDDEAFNVWHKDMGVPAERIIRIGDNKGAKYASDNFWQMGDTGPCGPCTEIFYDHGEGIEGGLPGTPEEDGDRFIEIWNVVFMQFNRTADGEMHTLPKPSVDTGMGLERIAAVMQNVHSNYEIDLFQALLAEVSKVLGGSPTTEASLRVIADHIRSCSFLIADGVMPSNEGRGNVLRRIIRRAVRHGNKLGAKEAFFYKLVAPLVDIMGQAYPELSKTQLQVEKILSQEEEQFAKTLDKGLVLLEQDIKGLSGSVIPGNTIFVLYDTYGFPVDLTNDIARERGLSLDYEGYEKEMNAQRERARASSKFGVDYNEQVGLEGKTEFVGYGQYEHPSEVFAVIVNGQETEAKVGDECLLILKETPFYAESGGQAGDTGELKWEGGSAVVKDTQKQGEHFLHVCVVNEGVLAVGQKLEALVNRASRDATALNHSATHLLHAGLRQILGEHVVQKGSLVNAERLRFDFAHYEAPSQDQLEELEVMVNQRIRENSTVTTTLTDMKSAKALGAMALFGEKYGESVRVLSMGDDRFSVELCGGTHVQRTGDIGQVVIVSEGGISSGVRRIEALTGYEAEKWNRESMTQLKAVSSLFKAGRDDLIEKTGAWVEKCRALEKELEQFKAKAASNAGAELASQAVDVGGIKVVSARLDGLDRKGLMDAVDKLKNQLGEAVVLLSTVDQDKAVLIAGVSKSISKRFPAGVLIKDMSALVGGKGGGRPDMAQGGGPDISSLDSVLEKVKHWVENKL